MTVALRQPAVPETPAGTVFTSWLAAFNSAEPAQMRCFEATYGGTTPLAQTLDFREETGGFTLLGIEKSEPYSLIALVQEKDSDTVARFELSVSSEEPPQIVNSTLLITPRPADLAIPRMTEVDALAALSTRAEEVAKNDQFSGALLVVRHGKVLLQKVWGRADRETGTAVTLDTQFRLGSMHKMFTATATLQLVEAGKLALDDTVGKHLSDYPNKDVASMVTVRHLLTHTGGTGDIFGPEFTENHLTLREHSDYVKLYGARALTHEPGAEYGYSNYGYLLLGALIEEVSGMSYYGYVRSKVLQPAGMESTDSLPEADEVPNRAIGYMKREIVGRVRRSGGPGHPHGLPHLWGDFRAAVGGRRIQQRFQKIPGVGHGGTRLGYCRIRPQVNAAIGRAMGCDLSKASDSSRRRGEPKGPFGGATIRRQEIREA